MYYIERYAPEGWVQAGYGEHLDAVCKVGQGITMNEKNRLVIDFWANHYLPDTVSQLKDAVLHGDTEWVIRHLLSLHDDVGKMLRKATDTAPDDKYSVPKAKSESVG